jgi:hypothetical protein
MHQFVHPYPVCESGWVFVTNHVLSGVLIGRSLGHRPMAGFIAGIGSHLALDAVPHWGCDTKVEGGPEYFVKIAKRDGVLGLATMAAAALAVDRRALTATVAAMAGAVVLDLDKPFKHFLGVNPFPLTVRRIHAWAQNEPPSGMPNEIAFGVACAAVDLVVTLASRKRSRLVPVEANGHKMSSSHLLH